MAASRDGVYIVLVNWNGWRDTIECLESVCRSQYHSSVSVVVCDNGSTDGSLEKIRAWAEGRIAVEREAGDALSRFVLPPVAKPISHVVLSRAQAEERARSEAAAPLLTLIDAGENLGFAGGCNVGLRYALRDADCGYVWLLNNDTVVDPDAIGALIRRLAARPDAGQCGSRILSYDNPGLVQARGGERYNRWLASSQPIGGGRPAAEPSDTDAVEREMSYVTAASLCVTRSFVETVGLLDEGYFLYCEEIDWLARARARFRLAYAHDSVVYHKEGRTIGSSRDATRRSALSDYYMVRSRLRFTWRHARVAFPTVVLGVLVAGVNRIRRWQIDRALTILHLLFSRDTYSRGARGVRSKSLSQR